MSRFLARLAAGFLLSMLGTAPALAGSFMPIGVSATADGFDRLGMTPIGSSVFPPSPHAAGDRVLVVQWCDRAADMQAVVDRHAAAGQAAANALYLELVERASCHFLPAAMPTAGRLIEQHGFALVGIAVPMVETEQRAVVEVWSATVEGIPGRAVYITLAHFVRDAHDALNGAAAEQAAGEGLSGRPIAVGCLRAGLLRPIAVGCLRAI